MLRQPVVQPQGEAKSFDWIGTQLAKRLGILDKYNAAINAGACGLPLKTDRYDFSLDVSEEHKSEQIWNGVCRAASFEVTSGEASDGLEYFKEHGFRTRPFSRAQPVSLSADDDLNLRFELPYQERVWRVGQQLSNRLHEQGIKWWDKQLAEYEPMPHYKDINRLWDDALSRNFEINPEDYPFWVLTSRSMQYSWGGNVGIQLMKEVADNVAGHDGIQINRGRAMEMGIAPGDSIEIISPLCSVIGKAILREGVRPDVIVMIGQFGHWKTPYAKDFKMPSLNPLVPMITDLLDGGGSTVDATKVKIRKSLHDPLRHGSRP